MAEGYGVQLILDHRAHPDEPRAVVDERARRPRVAGSGR